MIHDKLWSNIYIIIIRLIMIKSNCKDCMENALGRKLKIDDLRECEWNKKFFRRLTE